MCIDIICRSIVVYCTNIGLDRLLIIENNYEHSRSTYDGRSERFPYGEERARNQQGTSLLLVRPTANSSCWTTESVLDSVMSDRWQCELGTRTDEFQLFQ